MLSINIPVYNIEVNNLVLQLLEQAKKLDVSYEIRVYDDGSKNEYKISNRIISEYSNVVYVELEENLGRSAIRNKRGVDSIYQYLLFIDADSAIVKDNYLVYEDYNKYAWPPIDANLNGAYGIMALLYGQGDFQKTLIMINCGKRFVQVFIINRRQT